MRNGRESPSFWWADTNVRLWHVPAVPHPGDSSAVEGRAPVFWLVPRAAVRFGSVKRVGGAIGEGAAAVALIHQHLAADGAVPTLKGERPVGDVS